MPYKYRHLTRGGVVKDIPAVTPHLDLVAEEMLGVIRNTIAKQVTIAHRMAQAKAPVRKVFKGGRATFRDLSRLEMARITRRMMRAGPPGLVPYKISNRVMTHPNRKNTYERSWDLREARSSGKSPTGLDTFKLLNSWQESNRLNKEGRAALRSAKIVEVDEATWRDRGRGAIHVEVDAAGVPTYHLGGNLRASVRIRDDAPYGNAIRYSVVAGGERAPYAQFMEFGTRYVAARPFLRPALKHVEHHLAARVERDLRAHFGRG